jgi:hypothetical protein
VRYDINTAHILLIIFAIIFLPLEATSGDLPDKIIGKDGATMMLIPAGEFQIGDERNRDERPVHLVYLNAFYMDKYEVTHEQYKKFVDATGPRIPMDFNNLNYNSPDQPVIGVDWHDAKAYAAWAGKRLPTEAEWEKAARGGLVGMRYFWGNIWPPSDGEAGNIPDETAKKTFPTKNVLDGYDDGYVYPAPVGKFYPNGYGLYDMVGNVYEWCEDWYIIDYYEHSIGAPSNEDEFGLRRLATQIKAKKVIVKLFLKHPLYAKLYLLFRSDPNNPITTEFLGSSNLTLAGLSHQGELNIDVLDHDACMKLSDWFKDRWNDHWCIDISDELVQIIEESWAREELLPPYHIYVKMAYHLSNEARSGLAGFQIPKDFGQRLFEFQTAAVKTPRII